MISVLKRANRHFMYALVGLASVFSIMKDLFMLSAVTAYTTGTSYYTLLLLVSLLSVAICALFVRLVVYLSYRICSSIYRRRTGFVYPFPIEYREFESSWLAFALPCFLLAGVVGLPAFFLPTFSDVSGAVRSLISWVFLAIGAAYFVRNYGHDYDRKSLAFSLSIIPIVWLAINLFMVIVEVIR